MRGRRTITVIAASAAAAAWLCTAPVSAQELDDDAVTDADAGAAHARRQPQRLIAELRVGVGRRAVEDEDLLWPCRGLCRDDLEEARGLPEARLVVGRDVRLGVSSVTKVQVLNGISEGEAVALPGDRPLHDGDTVNPVFRQ